MKVGLGRADVWDLDFSLTGWICLKKERGGLKFQETLFGRTGERGESEEEGRGVVPDVRGDMFLNNVPIFLL